MATIADSSGNARHLTVATGSDWTVHSGDLPNGDNSASLSTTLNENAKWTTDESFCLPATAGSDAVTLEAWVLITNAGQRIIATVRTNGTATTQNQRHWMFYITTGEAVVFQWLNTASTPAAYLIATTTALAAGWHHVVAVVQCGSTRSVTIYVDGSEFASSSATTGSPTTAASAAYELYVGASRTNATEEMVDHMAKVAFYTRALGPGEIFEHYLAMVAT